MDLARYDHGVTDRMSAAGRQRSRLIGVAAVSLLLLAACGTTGTGGSAASIVPSASLEASPKPRVEALIEAGNGPIGLTSTSKSVWVELHRDDLVARIDPATNQQVEVTRVPVHCGLAASGESVWATIAKRDLVRRFDASTGEAVDSFDVPGACGLAVDGDTAWVTATGDRAVYVLQEGVAEPIHRIDVPVDPFDIVVDETSAWVTSESDGGTLYRIDRTSFEATLVGQFSGASFDSAEVAFGSVWLNAREQNHLWKLDPADGSVLGEIDLVEPCGVVAVGDALWITLLSGGLVQLDPVTLEIRSEEQLPYGFLGPPIYAFGSLWVSALEDNLVLRLRVDD
jgi:streptogramin lyase